MIGFYKGTNSIKIKIIFYFLQNICKIIQTSIYKKNILYILVSVRKISTGQRQKSKKNKFKYLVICVHFFKSYFCIHMLRSNRIYTLILTHHIYCVPFVPKFWVFRYFHATFFYCFAFLRSKKYFFFSCRINIIMLMPSRH